MPYCQREDARIHYQSSGDGAPLFLAFCLGGNAGMWGDEITRLSETRRVIVWDPLGHGGSDSPADPDSYGVNRAAQDLAALLDHLGYTSAVVGGVSMGAGIAACFAGRYPERTDAVLIVDSNTAAGLPVAEAVVENRQNTIALCEAGDMDAVAKFFLATSPSYRLFAAKTDANETRLYEMIRCMNPVGFANTLRSMLQAETVTEDLKRITSPALVLAGENDPAMKAVELTAKTIAHATFKTIPGAGHLSNIDQPDMFADAISQFLAGI